jgi:hypothetical protein
MEKVYIIHLLFADLADPVVLTKNQGRIEGLGEDD